MAMALPVTPQPPPPRRANGYNLRVILQYLNDREDDRRIAQSKVLDILGLKIRLDEYSTTPQHTWEYIAANLPQVVDQDHLNIHRAPDSAVILMHGSSGSGKTSTLCGHPVFNPQGIIQRLSGNLDRATIRAMELTRNGVRDLVAVHRRKKAGANIYTKMADLNTWNDLREARAEYLDEILACRKTARTANNEFSSRSFLCIYLKTENGQKWTFVDMPGMENQKKIALPNMNEGEELDMHEDSIFIKKVLFEFSFGFTKKNFQYKKGGLWKFILEGKRDIFLIACAKAAEDNKSLQTTAYFLHGIPRRGNKNPEKGTSRTPLYNPEPRSDKTPSGAISPAASDCSSGNFAEELVEEYVETTAAEYESVIHSYQKANDLLTEENRRLTEENLRLKVENETLRRRSAERDEVPENQPGPSNVATHRSSAETVVHELDPGTTVDSEAGGNVALSNEDNAELPADDAAMESGTDDDDDSEQIVLASRTIREIDAAYIKKMYSVNLDNEGAYSDIIWDEWLEYVRSNIWRCVQCREDKERAEREGNLERAAKIKLDRNAQHSVAHVFGYHLGGKYVCRVCDGKCSTPNHARRHCRRK